jgi:hypothetical protein
MKMKISRRECLFAAGSVISFEIFDWALNESEASMVYNHGLNQTEVLNANKLIAALKKTHMFSEKVSYKNLCVMAVRYIRHAITWFNQTPWFSFYSLNDTEFVDSHYNLIVDGAYRMWLADKDGHNWHIDPHIIEWHEQIQKVKGG